MTRLVFVDALGDMIHGVDMENPPVMPRVGEMIEVPAEMVENAPDFGPERDKPEPGGYVVQQIVHQLGLGIVHVMIQDSRIVSRLMKARESRERRPSHP